jgi:hypothetical protein
MIKAQISSVELYESRKVFIKDCVNVSIYNLSNVNCKVTFNSVVYPLQKIQSDGALSMPFVIDVSGHLFDAEIEIEIPKGGRCVVNQANQSKC